MGESNRVILRTRTGFSLLFLVMTAAHLFAGGSGLNVVVVVNTNNANSVELGNYYCEKRGVPPQNVLRIGWTGGVTDWARTNLDSLLRAPLTAMLASRQLTNQVEFIVLSMGIPYRVTHSTGSTLTSGVNSTTSALFYGFHPDDCTTCPAGFPSCNLPPSSRNSYAGSEGVFRDTPPISAISNSWLAVMLTSSNLTQAKALVDRGVASDGTFPTQTVYLAKSTDVRRNIRYLHYDDAIFNTRLRADYATQSTNANSSFGLGTMLGFMHGIISFTIHGSFAPGAMADNLTSYTGDLFGSADHTRVLGFINAGATASFGTVAEPCAYFEKFASPQNYFYQSRGFSVAECYYQSVTNPYQGILVGEPLAAPFARSGSGQWISLPADARLAGTTNLTIEFTAANPGRPIQRVDLFLDGLLVQTLTNLPPQTGNVVHVAINGIETNYTVPADASLRSVASNLTSYLNEASYQNATKVRAFAHGDRIELQMFELAQAGNLIPVSVRNHAGSASALTTFVRAGRDSFLDSIVHGLCTISVGGTVVLDDYLQLSVTKTNGSNVTVAITNTTSGLTLTDFVQQLVDAINATPGLQEADGLVAEDVAPSREFANTVDFHLRARTRGIDAARIQAQVSGTFDIAPLDLERLDGNLGDLQPRNHLYVTAGLTNLPLTFAFDTTAQPDGAHELTAVAYEGSHVRTQTRISRTIRIQNSSLAAVFNCLLCDTNTALEATLQFSVAANTNAISRIELFSTGGLWGTVSNQPTVTFSLAATNLGVGLHPFYAIVLRDDGQLYRTETKWIRILSDDTPFALEVAGSAPEITWAATAGRRYEVFSATNLADAFVLRDRVVPTNSVGQWTETNNSVPQRLYRIRSAQ